MRFKIEAIIFDMDGVISDTQTIMASVESRLLKEYDIHLPPDEISKRYAGTTSREMLTNAFFAHQKSPNNLEALISERRTRVDAAVHGNIKAIPGTLDFIDILKSRNVSLAVASASRTAFIKLVLSELGILEKFDALTSSVEVKRGKPEPDIFLLAAERLNVEPEGCMVIEDGIHGMVAARRAGMRCIGLVRNGKLDKDLYPADILVRDLREVDLTSIG